MPDVVPTPVPIKISNVHEDDWLTGAISCSIENGDDCEACQ